MKISVLMENTPSHSGIAAEHGLSLHISTHSGNILFDMGQTAAFADNAEKMGIDLASVDVAVLSHGHYDHGGGLARFLELNKKAPVYIPARVFGGYYNGTEKYIGLDPSLKGENRLIYAADDQEIWEGLSIHSRNDHKPAFPIESFGLNIRTESGFTPDIFAHEHYLLINEGDRKVLISGCAHKGVENIVRWFDADVFIGGFHLKKVDPESADGKKRLERTAQSLMESEAVFCTGHCTGQAQYDFLKRIMGDRLRAICSGDVFEI